MRFRGTICCLAGIAMLGLSGRSLAATTLYDGALGTAPAAQGWLHPMILGGTETVGATFTTFDTTANDSIRNGYTLTSPVTLDRTTGYTLRFDLGLLSESHSSNDRSGVSLIAIGSDLQGIELSFWNDRIWAQNAGFTHGEEALTDNLSGIREYDFSVQGTSYQLSADGNLLLQGSLRDYSVRGLVYNQPNLLFLGDDTTAANGAFQWSYASVAGNSVIVPEAGDGVLLLLGACILIPLIKRRLQLQRNL